MRPLSVIVDTANFLTMPIGKPKHNPILFVHPNAIKAAESSFELLEPVGGRNPKILDRRAGIQQIKLVLYPGPKLPRYFTSSFAIAAVINFGSRRVPETDNHKDDYT